MSNGSKERFGHPQELHGLPPTPLTSLQQKELDEFWRKTVEDIENTMNFDNHILPMSYVAKIIRDNQGSLMISSETPSCLTKVLEIFIQELTLRAWMCAKSHDRSSTILESDIYEAINSKESYVFLNDVLQRLETNHTQASMSSNAPQLHQESHFLAATSTLKENGAMDPLTKPRDQAFQIPKDNLVPAINAQPDPLELKNDEDLTMSTTSSGSIEEAK
ncbi:hypothetical protein SETIT_8G085800v2 [Setaria italica]|uniref:Core Histone H2A/H2B/H3 domain-containing protein n=1 Tax=Setaria italica TaxID=4555 RepID=K3ZJT5_SETIT|nr:hypothetical protein SETIT_8G085800v2 [Setaria italica]